jgi:short-subunit dehydrogenase
MKTILITGASGGIGEALANKLAGRKHNLLLVARNAEKLSTQCRQLTDKFGIDAQFIAADLSKAGTSELVFADAERRGLEVEMLINNAGIGSGGALTDIALQSELDLLQLNISSLVALTHLFLPQMQQRRSGTIVNVASMAGFMPIPYMATYAASKMFVRSFTEAISEECKPYNIHVMLLSPGLTRTNFNHASGIEGVRPNVEYKDSSTQSPEQVADEALRALDKGKHFIVSGKRNRWSARAAVLIPNAMITKIYAKSFRKKQENNL